MLVQQHYKKLIYQLSISIKNYFKLDQRPVSIVTDINVEPDFYENLTFEEYDETSSDIEEALATPLA